VVVPWGKALASFKLSGPPRLRRDITNLLSLVKAHALLHRATRAVDGRGRVIATFDDYEVVHELPPRRSRSQPIRLSGRAPARSSKRSRR
jgi:hypothetical protein